MGYVPSPPSLLFLTFQLISPRYALTAHWTTEHLPQRHPANLPRAKTARSARSLPTRKRVLQGAGARAEEVHGRYAGAADEGDGERDVVWDDQWAEWAVGDACWTAGARAGGEEGGGEGWECAAPEVGGVIDVVVF